MKWMVHAIMIAPKVIPLLRGIGFHDRFFVMLIQCLANTYQLHSTGNWSDRLGHSAMYMGKKRGTVTMIQVLGARRSALHAGQPAVIIQSSTTHHHRDDHQHYDHHNHDPWHKEGKVNLKIHGD